MTNEIQTAPRKRPRSFSIDMTQGNPAKRMLLFSLPLLLGNVFQQLYNTVDSMVVGRNVGGKALAAVGAGFPVMFGLMAMFFGVGMGATILISQAYGAGDTARLNRIVGTTYKMLLLAAIPMSIIGYFVSGPLLGLLNVPDDGTLAQATVYLQIIFIGMIGSMGFNINSGLLQGLGDGVTSLVILALSTVVNIGLDLLFVLVFHWGVPGVAIATVAAQWVSWIVGTLYINRRYDFIAIHPKTLTFDRGIMKEVIRLGIPSGLQQLMFSIGSMAMAGLVNSYGSNFMAGFNAANKVDTFIFLPIQSFTTAVTTFVGQNIGAKQLDRVKRGLRSGLAIVIVASGAIALILYPLSDRALRLFNSDPDIVQAGMEYLHAVLPFYFLLGVLFVYNAVLRGAGKTGIPTISSFISLWLARVPSAYLLTHFFGRHTLFYSYGIGWFMGILMSALYYYFGPWQKRLVRDLAEPRVKRSDALTDVRPAEGEREGAHDA